MKYLVTFIFLFICLEAICQQQLEMSPNQKKLSAFVKRYRNAIHGTPDSKGKEEIYLKMFSKHVIFIQDTLKSKLDGFIFKKAIIKNYIDKKNGQEYLDFFLDNGDFITKTSFTSKRRADLELTRIFRMAKRIDLNKPVKAFGTLSYIATSDIDVERGINRIFMTTTLDSICNVN